MNKFLKEFVSEEQRSFDFKLGNILASSLAGFVAGVLVASFAWMLVLYLNNF